MGDTVNIRLPGIMSYEVIVVLLYRFCSPQQIPYVYMYMQYFALLTKKFGLHTSTQILKTYFNFKDLRRTRIQNLMYIYTYLQALIKSRAAYSRLLLTITVLGSVTLKKCFSLPMKVVWSQRGWERSNLGPAGAIAMSCVCAMLQCLSFNLLKQW